MVYVNTDVYGDFSLSGAIFLDSRCPADFTAPYSIVYGHHIEDGGMFGDIVQFTQSDYFAAHTTGTLITDDTAYNIALFACVRADAYDPVLYDPAQRPDALLAYIKAHAVQRAGGGLFHLHRGRHQRPGAAVRPAAAPNVKGGNKDE